MTVDEVEEWSEKRLNDTIMALAQRHGMQLSSKQQAVDEGFTDEDIEALRKKRSIG